MQYNHKYIILYVAAFCLITFGACNKYLDITPKGYTLLTTVTDYDQWLNDVNGLDNAEVKLNLLSDNEDNPFISVPPSYYGDLIYSWAPQFSEDLNIPPVFWANHYARINKYNSLLIGIDKATGGTDEEKNRLKAEALLGRAFEYWYLVNEYGPEYDSTVAGKSQAIPFVISNDVSQIIPPRSSVQEIYDHIISDINDALLNLPTSNSANRFRGSLSAAYSVLARVYFYAGDYSDARKNAQLALQNTDAVMLDYNATLPSSPLLSIRPDVIYARQASSNEECDLGFLRSFESGDLRLQKLYVNYDGFTFTKRGYSAYFPASSAPSLLNTNFGTSVQEMKLIIAEAAVLSGDLSTALQQINDIRIGRFPSSTYESLKSNDRDTVLSWALRERSHELPYSGLRWFDMRRLDKANRMDTVYRYDAQNNIIATLSPHSPKYTLQIPMQVLQYHADWSQNPWE